LCDVGRVAVKHCFKLLSFFYIYQQSEHANTRHEKIYNEKRHVFYQPKPAIPTTAPSQHVRPPRTFAIAGLTAWNSLPDPVQNRNVTEAVFRRPRKTFLFARYRLLAH